ANGGEYASVRLGDGTVVQTRVPREGLPEGALQLGLRPEHIRLEPTGVGGTNAVVDLVERLGERSIVYARLKDGLLVTGETDGLTNIKVGDEVGLSIDGDRAHLFGPDGTGYHREGA